MFISVIIPNYNHATYLTQRIESVLKQTYQNFEVIILDDCSPDNSMTIINQYETYSKVVKIIRNEINSGSTFRQWDKGIALAKGEYIWIAESDDYADEHFLSNAIDTFTANPKVGLFFCNYNSIDEHSNIVEEENTLYSDLLNYLSGSASISGAVFCEKFLFFRCLIVNASAVVFKKKLYSHVSKKYMNMKVSGDWRMWADICYNTEVVFEKDKLNYYRMHTNNVRTKKALILPAEAIANYIYFIKKTKYPETKIRLRKYLAKMWIYSFRMNKNFVHNIRLLKKILQADQLFPFRLLLRVVGKR